jgi:hypothetical protein
MLNTGFGQNRAWYLTRGYNRVDDAWAVAVDSQGYVYWSTTELLPDSAYSDIFIYKIDSTGQELWKSGRLGGQFNEVAFIAVVKEPYVYVGGRIGAGAGGNADLLVVACRQSGDTLIREWLYSWDFAGYYEEVDGILVRNGALYVSGWASPTLLDQDIVIQKLDLSGRRLWSRVWAGTGIEGANGHMAADGQALYIGSHYGPLNRQGEALLIAFDQDSAGYRWSETWGRPDSDDAFFGLEMSSDSFIYAVGPSPMGLGIYMDINLVKWSRNGTKLWERRWGGPRHESGRAIAIDGDSVIYLAGSTSSYGAGQGDILVLKYNADGTLLDYQVWGGAGDDQVHDLVLAGDYLYLTGSTGSFGADSIDALLVRVDKRTLAFPDTLQGAGESLSGYQPDCGLRAVSPVTGRAPVHFSIAQPGLVEMDVFDLQGRRVLTLARGLFGAGAYTVALPLNRLSAGVYFLRLKAGQTARLAKIAVQR